MIVTVVHLPWQAAASLRCFNSRLKLEGVQICSSSLDNLPGQGDVQFIIAPLCISAAISSHALAQEVSLPALDIDMDLSPVTARLTDELLSFLQPGSSQAASSASAGLFEDQPQVRGLLLHEHQQPNVRLLMALLLLSYCQPIEQAL